jgi:hypothetical protein
MSVSHAPPQHATGLYPLIECVARQKFIDVSGELPDSIFKIVWEAEQLTAKNRCLVLAGYMLVLFYSPEDGGSVFLRNGVTSHIMASL